MEKRFVVFAVSTLLILSSYVFLQQALRPPRPRPADGDPPVLAENDPAEVPGDPPTRDGGSLDVDPDVGAELPDPSAAVGDDAEVQPLTSRSLPPEWITVGSYDGSRGPLLVTWNSRGGALERIELVERTASGRLRYRNLDESSGYLGHLALSIVDAGCRVNVVAAGTPAEQATPRDDRLADGLRPGDVITKIADLKAGGQSVEVRQPLDLDEFLDRTQPGAEVLVTVAREHDGATLTAEFQTRLDVRPFQMVRPEPLSAGQTVRQPLSCLFSLTKIDGRSIEGPVTSAGRGSDPLSQRNGVWEYALLDGPRAGVEFRLPLQAEQLEALGLVGSLELVKRFRLGQVIAPDDTDAASPVPYHLDFELEIRNRGQQSQQISYQLDGPNGLPLEGWWYSNKIHPKMFYSAGARDILVQTFGDRQQLIGCSAIYKTATKRPESPHTALFAESDPQAARTIKYVGVDTQYFTSTLIPQGEEGALFQRAEAMPLGELPPKRLLRTTNVSFRLDSPAITIAPGGSYRQEFTLFAGPKRPELLAHYGLQETIYYGWFGAVARPLSSVLHFFYHLIGNFGLAIILLTVLVRSLMFPLSRKAAKNAAMMQELAPEMKAIAEKFKNDMEKRAKAQQELFRRHNYNPLGGCWLMFLQLPIFIGLYRCLSVDIELRQASLIPGIRWCSNLAGPDQLFYWGDLNFLGLFSHTGMLGPYFNILPIFTIVLFLMHQKLFTPPATDDQTRMQMQMMKFMTLFIGIMFFKVASGLCLYFIASSLWGIAERKLLPKSSAAKSEEGPAPAKDAAGREQRQRDAKLKDAKLREAKLRDAKPQNSGRTGSNGTSKGGGKSKKRSKRR